MAKTGYFDRNDRNMLQMYQDECSLVLESFCDPTRVGYVVLMFHVQLHAQMYDVFKLFRVAKVDR